MTLEIDGFAIGDRIGGGGFGDVFRARHEALGRDVAIKVLHAERCRDPAAVARFVAEARAANRIEHEGIVQVHRFGALADGRQYYVMDLLEGRTLRALIDDRGAVPIDEAIPILRRVAAAVDAAHAAGVAHRDLKPENLFLLDDGGVKVIDFGLAKLSAEVGATATGAVLGTPRYMSPEQCRGSGADWRSDLYSFGAVAYHMVAGAPPFDGDPLALALHHLNDDPLPPSRRAVAPLPAGVDRVILELLRKDPGLRPHPLAAAVDGMLAAGPRSPARARRLPVLAAAALVPALGAAVGVVAWRSGGDGGRGDDLRPALETGVAVPRYTQRKIEAPFGDSSPPRLAEGGRDLTYRDPAGSWRLDLASGARTPIDGDGVLVGIAFDGAALFETQRDGKALVEAASRAGGSRRVILEGDAASLSPDGRQLVVRHEDWFLLHDLEAGATRRLIEVPGLADLPRWSPDGRSLLWAESGLPALEAVRLTRVADGTTRRIVIPALKEAGPGLSAPDFADDQHLVYCALDGGNREIRVHSLDPTGGMDATVSALDPDVASCSISSAGDRIAVVLHHGRPRLAAIDLAAPADRALRLIGDGRRDPLELDEAGTLAVAFDPEAPWREFDVPLDGTAGREVAVCPGQEEAARRGWRPLVVRDGPRVMRGEWEFPANAAARLHLRSHEDCSVIGTWTVPGEEWHTPRCRGGLCATTTISGGDLVVWRLELDRPPREIGRAPATRVGPLPGGFASLAISPDGARVVAIAGTGATPYVFPARGGAGRAVPVECCVQAVAWGRDPSRFVVSGVRNDEAGWVREVSFAGAARDIWRSTEVWFLALTADEQGRTLIGTALEGRTELVVLDRVRDTARTVAGQPMQPPTNR